MHLGEDSAKMSWNLWLCLEMVCLYHVIHIGSGVPQVSVFVPLCSSSIHHQVLRPFAMQTLNSSCPTLLQTLMLLLGSSYTTLSVFQHE